MVGKCLAAILIMTEFSLLREAPALKPPKATAKPYTRHILGIDSGLQSHLKATLRPPHSHTTATPQPHQSQLLRLFQRLEGAETACSPRVLAIMRIAGLLFLEAVTALALVRRWGSVAGVMCG